MNPMLFFYWQSASSGSFLASNWPLLAILLVFTLMWYPQIKRQKAQQRFVEGLQKGDEVVTDSGIIGIINKIEDNTVTLKIDSKSFIKVLRSTISRERTDQIKNKN